MEKCEEQICNNRRDFLVKATTIAGGLALSLSATAGTARGADDGEVVLKIKPTGDLMKSGAETFETSAGPVIVIKDDSGFRAFSAKCTHKGGELSYDKATKTLACPLHGSKFDGATGAVTKGPASKPLPAYGTESAVVVSLKPKS